jgi:hypothetical protein
VIISKEKKEVSHLIPCELLESNLKNVVEDRIMRLCEALENFDDPAEEESSKVVIEIDVNKFQKIIEGFFPFLFLCLPRLVEVNLHPGTTG